MHQFQQVLTWFVWRLLCRYIAFEAYWSKSVKIKHTLKVIMLFMQLQYVHINLQKLQVLNNESFDVHKLKYQMNKIFHLYLSSKSKAQMLRVKKYPHTSILYNEMKSILTDPISIYIPQQQLLPLQCHMSRKFRVHI